MPNLSFNPAFSLFNFNRVVTVGILPKSKIKVILKLKIELLECNYMTKYILKAVAVDYGR